MELFDKLPKDILILIVTDLDLNSISNFCLVYPRLDKYLSLFWKNRIKKEYPGVNIENVIIFKELYKLLIELESQEHFNLPVQYMEEISKNIKFKDRDKFEGDVYVSFVTGGYEEIYNVTIYTDLDKLYFNEIMDDWRRKEENKISAWFMNGIYLRIDEYIYMYGRYLF